MGKVTICDLKAAEAIEVTICDFKFLNSLRVNWNMKSFGKRSMLRFTAWMRTLGFTPYSSARCVESMTF